MLRSSAFVQTNWVGNPGNLSVIGMLFAGNSFCANCLFCRSIRSKGNVSIIIIALAFSLVCICLPATTAFGAVSQVSSAMIASKHTSPTYPIVLRELITNALTNTNENEPLLSEEEKESLGRVLFHLNGIDAFWDTNPNMIPEHLNKLKQISQKLALNSDSNDFTALDEILLHLDRRIVLYRLICESFKDKDTARKTGRPKKDFDQICSRTIALEQFFAQIQDPEVEHWAEFLALSAFAKQLHQEREQFPSLSPSTMLSSEQIYEISENANMILSRFALPLTREQEQFLSYPAIVQWKRELEKWKGDTVNPLQFLAALEQYEAERLLSEAEMLYELSDRLILCKSENLQQLGKASRKIYDGPNVKFYVSEVLINHFLPAQDPEFDRVRDVVVGRRVVGYRRTDTLVKLALVPDSERLNMSLRITGKVSATGHSQVRKTRLTSGTYATFRGEKQLEWTEQGFRYSPSVVGVNNRTYLQSIKTGIDGLPLLGDLVKEIAKNQFTSQEGQITAETRTKITNTVNSRIDSEVNSRIQQFNANFQKNILEPMDRFGLNLENRNSSTTKDWLLSSWHLGSDYSLGSHTPEPETIHGAFADFKVHESAVQAVLQSLDLAGKTMTTGELRNLIAEKIGHSHFAMGFCENEDVILCFAEKDPVIVRFHNGRVEITLSMAAMKVNRSLWKHFQFIVNYRPDHDSNGNLCLVRDQGHVIGPRNARVQLALRTVFTKIFPPNRTIPLVLPVFETDERFVQLTTGMCRLENGWFALAVIEKE